ncbi:uncharacterized protein T551_00840 [Pneumocystis jirovecii RU7]|uniref:TATA-binding protein interacting (TIP20) domain-containing protein n=1 Tax=Pneumocystis jirovecii (strain RU7) TaxID=1408657 RepID=A0A0W4ZUV3_PNEJ7|nr:uncharacterized protein T551_00840 [Pneumocystis jirovecii RU7]KTW32158.1 hypothetical protein T551_00840 [Pneumocystis jirovecii RU7]
MADKELKLLSGVEFHLALADTDIKLENTLKTYLCPMLLKLASPHDIVRKKVVQICGHIRIQTKSNENIKFPIDALLEQFFSKDVGNSTKSFTLLFLDMAFFRLNEEEKKKLLPKLILGLSGHPIEHKKRFIYLIFHILEIYGSSNEDSISQFEKDDSIKSIFDSETSFEDFSFLAKIFRDLALFSLSYFHSLLKKMPQAKIQEFSFSNHFDKTNLSNDTNFSLQISVLKKTCPGLSFDSLRLLTFKGNDTFTIDSLTKIKIGTIWFLSTNYFSLDQKFTTLSIFKFDPDDNISLIANACLKKLPIIDLENEKIIENIYELLLGNNEGLETMHRDPVSSQIYIYFINLLSKSRHAIKNMENIPRLLSYGLQSNMQKLGEATVTFIHWIARMSSDESLKSVSLSILNLLLTYIQNSDSKSEIYREHLFTSLGLIAKRGMENMEIPILKLLFDSLKKETKLVRFSIEQSLSLIMPHFQNIQGRLLDELNSLLFEIIVSDHIDIHFSALRYCLTVFPFHESKARMLCLLCLRENCKPEVIEEAKKGLNPYWFLVVNQMKSMKQTSNIVFSKNNHNPFFFPIFEDLIEILENQKLNNKGDNFFSQRFQMQAPTIKNYMIKFIRQTLIMNLLRFDESIRNGIPLSRAWEEQLDIAISTNDKFRTAYKKGFDVLWNENSKFKKYLTNYFRYLIMNFFEIPSEFAYNILELLSLGSPDLTIMLTDKIDLLENIVLSFKDIEYDIFRVLGIVGSHPNISIEKVIELLTHFIDDQTFQNNQQIVSKHASLLSLGYLLSRLKCRNRLIRIDSDLLNECYDFIIEKISSDNNLEKKCALIAFGELSIFNVFSDFKILNEQKFSSLVMIILDMYKKIKLDTALQEIIITTLGKISVIMNPEDFKIGFVLNSIFENHEREDYLYFADGEALSCIAAGWKSTYLHKFLDMSISYIPETSRLEYVDFILKKILKEYITSTKLSLKKASVIWLLSLVQYCGKSSSIQANILNIQNAFIMLLSNKDSFIQESASKGLKLLYEKCSEEIKSNLVHNLVSCLITDGKNYKRTISSETELFDYEIHSGDNNPISTYGDVCKLATEVGNPELIYQFLNIASSSAIWQSKKGVAFSINEIILGNFNANIVENDPELSKKLVSCLFLYKFHPVSNIRKTMESIFKVFVDSEKIVQFYTDIIKRLLKGISDQSWYIREASCNAFVDIFQTQTFENIEPYLDDIITMSLRRVDDVKETVRSSASILCRSISSFIVKNIESKDNNEIKKKNILEKSIPIFLKSVHSDAEEVKIYSLDILIKICNVGKSSLKYFISELVDNLLNFLTELEPQVMNYLELNVDKYDITQEQLDDSRVSLLRVSPILSAIEYCIDQLDDDVVQETMSIILNNTLKAVGLSTKLACSKLIISIILKKRDCVSSYATDIFKTFYACLFDRNYTVRISFSTSLGYIARIALDKDLVFLDSSLKKMYFEEEDEKKLITIASVYKHMSTYANEKFVALFSVFLPVVFLGKHDLFESVRFLFNETWNENTGNSSSINLYLEEILDYIVVGLENNYWRSKKISATALIQVIKVSRMDKYLNKFIPLLIDILRGKFWKGKETVLDAFITLLFHNESYLLDKENLIQETFNILNREIKRNDINYKRHVLHNFNRFIESYSNFESFENIYLIIEKFISNDSEKIQTCEDNEISKPMGLILREYALKIIANAFNSKSDRIYVHYLELVRIWKENIQLATWNIQIVICQSIQKIFKKNFLDIHLFDQLKNTNVLLDNWNVIYHTLSNKSYESVRSEAMKAAKIFIQSLKNYDDPKLKSKISVDFNELKSTEVSPMIKTELEHINF